MGLPAAPFALVLALGPLGASGHAGFFTCDRSPQIGEKMMTAPVRASDKAIEVLDASGRRVPCGGSVAAGETVSARIDGLTSRAEYLIDVDSAAISDGRRRLATRCENTRSINEVAYVEMPTEAGTVVAFLGAHADEYGPVDVTEACEVTAAIDGGAPAPAPPRPAAPAPTPSPTVASCESDLENDATGTFYDFAIALDGRLSFHWSLVDGGRAISVALDVSGGGDDQWVSLGWGDGAMVGTECVIAEGDAAPAKYEISSKRRSGIKAMDAQTLADASTTTGTDGRYVVRFTKVLAEAGETVVGADTFVWARGSGRLAHHGGDVGALAIDLETCAFSTKKVAAVNSRKIRAHGGLMVVAFAALMPLAIVAAKARFLRSKVFEIAWFRVHVACNVAATLLAVAGVAMATSAIDDADDADHLVGRHPKLGVAALVSTAAMVAAGAARPAKASDRRWLFDYGHATLGYATLVLAVFATRSGISKASDLDHIEREAVWYDRHLGLLAVCLALYLAVVTARIVSHIRESDRFVSPAASPAGKC